jgi:lactoylglutathione lyase
MTAAKTRGRSPLADAVSDSPDGVVVAELLIVEDVERSLAFYRDVLGAVVERENPPAMLRLHNAWLVLNVGGEPSDDKSDVMLTPPQDPRTASAFLNIRVADIAATHALWTERGAQFLTAPTDRGPEVRCYLRDPDGHLIEVGQTKGSTAGKPTT